MYSNLRSTPPLLSLHVLLHTHANTEMHCAHHSLIEKASLVVTRVLMTNTSQLSLNFTTTYSQWKISSADRGSSSNNTFMQEVWPYTLRTLQAAASVPLLLVLASSCFALQQQQQGYPQPLNGAVSFTPSTSHKHAITRHFSEECIEHSTSILNKVLSSNYSLYSSASAGVSASSAAKKHPSARQGAPKEVEMEMEIDIEMEGADDLLQLLQEEERDTDTDKDSRNSNGVKSSPRTGTVDKTHSKRQKGKRQSDTGITGSGSGSASVPKKMWTEMTRQVYPLVKTHVASLAHLFSPCHSLQVTAQTDTLYYITSIQQLISQLGQYSYISSINDQYSTYSFIRCYFTIYSLPNEYYVLCDIFSRDRDRDSMTDSAFSPMNSLLPFFAPSCLSRHPPLAHVLVPRPALWSLCTSQYLYWHTSMLSTRTVDTIFWKKCIHF